MIDTVLNLRLHLLSFYFIYTRMNRLDYGDWADISKESLFANVQSLTINGKLRQSGL